MSGDGGPVKQPLKFYSKDPTDIKDILLQTGKVKTVYVMEGEPEKVYVHFHDKVTAGNGKRSEIMDSKGKVCCLISALLFELMESRGIKTHYIDVPYLDTLLCKKLTIVPVEVIVRNIAAGSIVSQTTLQEGTLINPPIVEYFLKDDAKDDPLLTHDRVRLMGIDPEPMKKVALEVNTHLKMLFAQMDIDLVDFKLEFGYDVDENLLLADELSPDNMRLWKKGTKQKFDKDLFRKGEGDIVTAYTYILEELRKFI
jgi:phosphoribosylaminoimidazole-succinocarboxamide synthase